MAKSDIKWQCRIAPSLGDGFAGTPNEVWGTVEYTDLNEPCVFFGMYGLKDVDSLYLHTGKKAILWAGSDITNMVNGYWMDAMGKKKLDGYPKVFDECDHYVENWVEQRMLERNGLKSKIVPSFLGNIDDYELQEQPERQQYYTSVSGDDFGLYGWDEIQPLAIKHPDIEFHLYGNHEPWLRHHVNIFVHGRVSQEQMNEETSKMTGAFRLTEFDGFSEILAKSILWGQWPVSPYIKYPHMDAIIRKHKGQNIEGRDYYRKILNAYPWNVKNNS